MGKGTASGGFGLGHQSLGVASVSSADGLGGLAETTGGMSEAEALRRDPLKNYR